jgi:hypothetical protein
VIQKFLAEEHLVVRLPCLSSHRQYGPQRQQWEGTHQLGQRGVFLIPTEIAPREVGISGRDVNALIPDLIFLHTRSHRKHGHDHR